MTIEAAAQQLHETVGNERWFIGIGVPDDETLVLRVTNRVKAERRFAKKRPLHWFGFRMRFEQVSRPAPALRGGIGNHAFIKEKT